MTDTIDRLIALKERIETLLNEQAAVDQKCINEITKMETELALASALAALRAASSDCKHERVRTQIKGAREQVQRALAG